MPSAPHDPEEFDPELPSPPVLQASPSASRGGRIARILTNFFLGQGAAQGASVLAAMFLVRRLSVEAYAQFGLASSFQSIFAVLMDLGFASTIVPLVGERAGDLVLIGRYVRAAKYLRDRAFWVLAPIASVSFLAVMHHRGWGWSVQLPLLASVLVALYSVGKVAYFAAPLFVMGKLREYYVPQIVTGMGRLSIYACLALTGGLNAWTAAGLTAINITVNGQWIGRKAQEHLTWPEQDDPAVVRELLRYILPASPAIIFSAFQAQISLLLISLFGGTQYLAEVTALSRIGQLFAVLMTFNAIVVEPYVARLPRHRLKKTYAGLIFAACCCCAPIVGIAFRWPGIFVWLIGSQYDSVRPVMGWYVLSASNGFIAGLIWVMNRSRKWVFWSGSIFEVALLLGAQIAFLVVHGVRTTADAVNFSLVTSICAILVHLYVMILGFVRGPRVGPTALGESAA